MFKVNFSYRKNEAKLPRIKQENHLNVRVHEKIKQIREFRNWISDIF